MKKLWGWVKDRWVVVVCCALIVLSLPLAFFFSQRWAGSVQSRQEKAANDLLTRLNTASRVNYAVPSVVPGVPAIEQSAEPNVRRTAFFKAQKDAIVGAASGVIAAAEKFNKRSHGLIMEDIFPDPAPGQDVDSLTLEFAERIVGRTSSTGQVLRPSVYQKLFDAIKAGPPADPVRLATMLEDRRLRAIEQKKGADGAGRSLTKEEEEEITKGLINDRLGEYRRRAGDLSVYASMDVLPAPSEAREGGSWVPRDMPKSPPKVWECFSWQFDYWVIDDLLAAVARANTGPDGRLTPVEDSVVKRIEKIKLDESGFVSQEGAQQRRRGGDEDATEEASASETDEVKPDYKESLTGRTAAPVNKANGVYDIRKAEMTVIVSSARLPQLLSAISATNFMTVVDCDLSEVNVWGDLAQGYYYGDEHVVRARLSIETVWLRSLTKPLMPREVKDQLNIKEPEAPAEGGAPAGGEKPAGGPG